MRKAFVILGLVLVATSNLLAQREITGVERFELIGFNNSQRAVTDTLFPGDFVAGTKVLYSTSAGYIVGTNDYADRAKVQVFELDESIILEGVLFYFGAKQDADHGSTISAAAYRMDNYAGTTTEGNGNRGPGSVITSVQIALSDIDITGGHTVAMFPEPIIVYDDFALGFSMDSLQQGDMVGLVSSSDGDAGESELSWEQWEDSTWHTMLSAWPLDVDFGVLAVVDNSTSGIDDRQFFNGIKAEVFPNPSKEIAHLVFELESASKVDLRLIDASGKVVYFPSEKHFSVGRHSMDIPVNDLAAGVYYYSIGLGSKRLTKKLVVSE